MEQAWENKFPDKVEVFKMYYLDQSISVSQIGREMCMDDKTCHAVARRLGLDERRPKEPAKKLASPKEKLSNEIAELQVRLAEAKKKLLNLEVEVLSKGDEVVIRGLMEEDIVSTKGMFKNFVQGSGLGKMRDLYDKLVSRP